MTQHASLSPERWSAFNLDQQILMIGNEMNRASRWMRPEDRTSLNLSYERILRLVDLTVEVNNRPSLRRELLRWRDLIAELYVHSDPDPAASRTKGRPAGAHGSVRRAVRPRARARREGCVEPGDGHGHELRLARQRGSVTHDDRAGSGFDQWSGDPPSPSPRRDTGGRRDQRADAGTQRGARSLRKRTLAGCVAAGQRSTIAGRAPAHDIGACFQLPASEAWDRHKALQDVLTSRKASPVLLVPERFDRIEAGCANGGHHPEEDADSGREAKADRE